MSKLITQIKRFALALCLATPIVSWAAGVGDTVTWTNADGLTADEVVNANHCSFSLQLPAMADLPAGSVVRITNVQFASINSERVSNSGNNQNDPHSISIGNTRSSEVSFITSETLAGKYIDSYDFSDGVEVEVGKTYGESWGAAYTQFSGCGVTFLHSNGNRWSGGTTMNCTVGGTTSGAIANGTTVFPIYKITATVVAIGYNVERTIEANADATWGAEEWTVDGVADQAFVPSSDIVYNVTVTVGGDCTVTMPESIGSFRTCNINFVLDGSAEAANVTLKYSGTLPEDSITLNPFGDALVNAGSGVTLSPVYNGDTAGYVVSVSGLAVTILKGANYEGTLTADTNWSAIKPEGWANAIAGDKPSIVVNYEGEEPVTLTFDETVQAGSLTINGNIVVAASAAATFGTVNAGAGSVVEMANMTITTKSGAGAYRYRSDYPVSIPRNITYEYIGGATEDSVAAVSGAMECHGTLKTSGYLRLADFWAASYSALDVVAGKTFVNSTMTKFLSGTITIRENATFVNEVVADALNYSGSKSIYVYGTLDMGATRWSLGSNNTINLYEGCTVTGSGQGGNGTFDWIENATATMNVYGDVNLAAPIRIRSTGKLNVNVDTTDQKGLTLAGTIGGGTLVKKGAGLVKFTTNPPYAITVENGAFTFAVDATPTITYSAEPGAGTTMSMWYATQATWKGTVVLGVLNAPEGLPLNTYGNENSKIVLTGTTGSCYLNGTTTVAAEVVVGTNENSVVEFNNGNSNQVGTFSKVSGPGTLKLTGWTGCSSATYNLNTIDGFTGTLAIHNAITRDGGGTFTIGIGNIVTTAATTPGSKVLNLTQTAVSGATGTVVYNTANAQVNGNAAKLAVTANGVYVASASTTIGGVTAYYNNVITAFTAVSAGSAGDTLTILNGSEYGEVKGFSYDSNTKTYTKVQVVAQFTNGVTYQYPTIADACKDAELLATVPTVELLVEFDEQTVLPSGWQYNNAATSGTTYGTLTFTGYVITSSTVLSEDGSFTIPENTKVIKLGVRDVTAGFDIDGTTATLIAPNPVEDTGKKAIDVGATEVTLNVALVPGLYYGVASGTELTLSRPAALTQYTGDNGATILTVDKPVDPEDSTKKSATGFFKVFVDIKE